MAFAMTLQHPGIHNTSRRPSSGRLAGKENVLRLSLCCNGIFLLGMLYLGRELNIRREVVGVHQTNALLSKSIIGYDRKWHGGHPAEESGGSCWCGAADGYCMCTPSLAIDLVITSSSAAESNASIQEASALASAAHYIWLVRRKDTGQLATMGGFVEVDETVEQTVKRELKEEMGIELTVPPRLVGIYSDPRRDLRRRTASVVFAVHLSGDFHPQAGDDAKEVVKIPIDDVEIYTYYSDHRTILLDYRARLRGETPSESSEGDFADDIFRSTCSSS